MGVSPRQGPHKQAGSTIKGSRLKFFISQASTIQHDFGGGYFRKLAISRNVYRIKEDDWFGSASKWKIVAELPKDRVSFSVLSLDSSKICAVGRDFCDILDTETMTWISIELDKQRSQFNGQKTPLVASVGSVVYVICAFQHLFLDCFAYFSSQLIFLLAT